MGISSNDRRRKCRETGANETLEWLLFFFPFTYISAILFSACFTYLRASWFRELKEFCWCMVRAIESKTNIAVFEYEKKSRRISYLFTKLKPVVFELKLLLQLTVKRIWTSVLSTQRLRRLVWLLDRFYAQDFTRIYGFTDLTLVHKRSQTEQHLAAGLLQNIRIRTCVEPKHSLTDYFICGCCRLWRHSSTSVRYNHCNSWSYLNTWSCVKTYKVLTTTYVVPCC